MPPDESDYQDPLLPKSQSRKTVEGEDSLQAKPDHVQMDQIDPHEPVQRRSVYRRKSFFMEFVESKGPPQIVLLILLLALALGSTVGVVPAVMTDRFARLRHGFVDEQDCSDFPMGDDKPSACLQGSADAQNAAAFASLVSNSMTFVTGSLMGSISDQRGRKGIMLFGLSLSLLSPTCLVLMQIYESMSPKWYYAASASTGLVSWIAVALSSLSDVLPPKWRSAGFGLLLAGFSLGFALAPIMALVFDHFQVSVVALCLIFTGFLVAVFFLPETLPPSVAAEAARNREAEAASATDRTLFETVLSTVLRPVRELSILNRNTFFRLLSSLAFFSGMVSSADQTLLIYYVEERLAFDDHDVAIMFMMMGLLGILVQGFLIKPFTDCLGERMVIVLAFTLGSLDNFLYGMARTKATIFIAIAISSFTGMSFPTISAIKANNVVSIEGIRYRL